MRFRESKAIFFLEKIYDQKAFSISSGSGAVKERAFPVMGWRKESRWEWRAADPAVFGIIEIISDERAAKVAHVNPDLVGPAGLQFQRDEGETISRLQPGEMSHGGLSGLEIDFS